MTKLTPSQMEALSIIASKRPFEPSWSELTGVNGTSLWALERRGLVTWARYADGLHFSVTDAGRAALSIEQGETP